MLVSQQAHQVNQTKTACPTDTCASKHGLKCCLHTTVCMISTRFEALLPLPHRRVEIFSHQMIGLHYFTRMLMHPHGQCIGKVFIKYDRYLEGSAGGVLTSHTFHCGPKACSAGKLTVRPASQQPLITGSFSFLPLSSMCPDTCTDRCLSQLHRYIQLMVIIVNLDMTLA